MFITDTWQAGETKDFTEEADFFRLLEATDKVTIIFYFSGREVARSEKVSEGYSEKFLVNRFNTIKVKNESTGPQTLQFVTRLGNEVEYNKNPVGDVNVKNFTGAAVNFYHLKIDLQGGTNVVWGGSPNRRFLMIQNQGPTQVMFRFDGSGNATNQNSILLSPNETFTMDSFCYGGYLSLTVNSTNPNDVGSVHIAEGA